MINECIKKTLTDIETAAKQKAKPDAVVHEQMAVGEYHRQGDVYLVRVSANYRGCTIQPQQRQLAPGETQGSRHIIRESDMAHLEFLRIANPTPLDGPRIKAKKAFTVDHPEHGAVTLPAGTYDVKYQRQYAQEMRRVAD
jgi:hypothetical protein